MDPVETELEGGRDTKQEGAAGRCSSLPLSPAIPVRTAGFKLFIIKVSILHDLKLQLCAY